MGAMPPPESRHILHVDMDAFYAAVEQRDRPELRGKPVLVGGDPSGRGVVSTASYEARTFGCRSAMPMSQAVRLCPQAVVITPRMEAYAGVSRQVFAILEQFTPLIEPLSIDEAFLDVTGSVRLLGPAENMAREMKRRITEATQLTASVGVAPNKFVAKLASDLRKPDGLVVVRPEEVRAFLDPLPVSRLWGVGKATLPRFEQIGVRTFGDASRLAEDRWVELFGEHGRRFHLLVQGIDDRAVVCDREARSISHEETFAVDLADRARLRAVLLEQVDQVARRLRRGELLARTVVLKIRTPDFTTVTRRITLDDATDRSDLFREAAARLWDAWAGERRTPIRLLGVGVTQLEPAAGRQPGLFDGAADERRRELDQTVDSILQRFGPDAIVRGRKPEQPRS